MSRAAWWTCALVALAAARVYERCELARDLRRLHVRDEHISTWVCIAYHESRFDTAAQNPSSGDHGLLQISELYWCGPGKVCGVPCSAFRDEDIADDVECAQLIHEEHTRLQGDGFLAWVVYPLHCKHNTKKYLADCDTMPKNSSVKPADKQRAVPGKNLTSPTAYSNIDELKPPYLAITSVLRGSYGNYIEQNNYRRNWLDYKVDNIDELTLPVFRKYTSEKITASTRAVPPPVTTTTRTTQIPRVRVTTAERPISRAPTTKTTAKTNAFKETTMVEKKRYHFSTITSPKTSTPTPKKYEATRYNAPVTPAYSVRAFSVASTARPTTKKAYSPYTFKRHFETVRPTTPAPPTTTKKIPPATTAKPTTAKRHHFSFSSHNATTTQAQKITNNIQFSTKRPFATKQSSPWSFASTTPKSKSIIRNTPSSSSTSISQAPTTKTTQSIFDLYLKPTPRPKLLPFTFSSLHSLNRLRIFADGTTPAPKCRSQNGC